MISFWKNSNWTKKMLFLGQRLSVLELFSWMILACTSHPNHDSPEMFLSYQNFQVSVSVFTWGGLLIGFWECLQHGLWWMSVMEGPCGFHFGLDLIKNNHTNKRGWEGVCFSQFFYCVASLMSDFSKGFKIQDGRKNNLIQKCQHGLNLSRVNQAWSGVS